MRLAQTHSDLVRKLDQSVQGETAFLGQTEQHIKDLASPLDKFRIRSQQRRRGESVSTAEENSVGELVARAEEQVREFEKEVEGLWKEWAVAEQEVKGLLRGIGGVVGAGGDDEGGSGEGEEIVERFREMIEREIEEAEERAVEIGEKAVAMMKDIEKVCRALRKKG